MVAGGEAITAMKASGSHLEPPFRQTGPHPLFLSEYRSLTLLTDLTQLQ